MPCSEQPRPLPGIPDSLRSLLRSLAADLHLQTRKGTKRGMRKPGYSDSVFINCPFDDQYQPILRAILYTIYRCGFFPRTALDEDNGTDYRLDKIIRKVRECRYGIHDLSRTQSNKNGYPRFNMPFELGVFFGARHFGGDGHKAKNALILEGRRYSVQQLLSDINGIDPRSHNNDPKMAMSKTRDWLRIASGRRTIPGYAELNRQYSEFNRRLPTIAHRLGFTVAKVPYVDLVNIIEEALEDQLSS